MTEHEIREIDAVVERYARRAVSNRYDMLNPDVWQTLHERQRALLRLFGRLGFTDLAALRLVEVGSGGGSNLLELLRLGFAPHNLCGIELLPERHARARRVLPEDLVLYQGDALLVELPERSQDIVFVSTVFSSLLDDAFQQRLADLMWRWVRPGGGVLWYDMTVGNPRNPDVRGVPLRRVQELFAPARLQTERVTLAPPIARAVCRIHPSLYTLFNALPFLRTHALCWLPRP